MFTSLRISYFVYRRRKFNFANLSKVIRVNNAEQSKLRNEDSNEDPDLLSLKDAISEGHVNLIKIRLTEAKKQGHDILLTNDIVFDDLSLRYQGKNVKDTLSMTPFHFAILAHQSEIVKMMLNFASHDAGLVKEILSAKTKVQFTGDMGKYYKDDLTTDGVNAIHLATKFHVESLLLIIQFLYSKDLLGNITETVLIKIKSRMIFSL